MVDIQSPTAEIRRGKEKRRKRNKRQDENIYGLPYYMGQTIKIEEETTGQKYSGLLCSIGRR